MRLEIMTLLLAALNLFAQYDTVRDPRKGGLVRYAGDYGSKPTVLLPRNPRIDRNTFRGIWVATVENLDFPISRNPEDFKRNFRKVVTNLKNNGANAIVFQVRPMNDAFYQSRLNPWSAYLSGKQGQPIGFDPLPYMIAEAHKHGLQFHAWLNPYRIAAKTDLGKNAYLNTLAPNNFARKNPNLVLCTRRSDGLNQLIYDPGNPKTIQFLCATVREIISKYPVDAIHMDDYFYPYDGIGNADAASFRANNKKKLDLDSWRRANVDTLVYSLSTMIRNYNRTHKKNIQFGISPFGIWVNKQTHVSGSLTGGSESYYVQHADTRKWMKLGWIDYIVPQLYWTFGHNKAAYAALADWWALQARGSRTRLYLGLSPARLGSGAEWSNADEIYNQMRYNSRNGLIRGVILFSYRSLFSPSNETMRKGSEKALSLWRNCK